MYLSLSLRDHSCFPSLIPLLYFMVLLYLDISLNNIFSNFSILNSVEMEIILYVFFVTFFSSAFFCVWNLSMFTFFVFNLLFGCAAWHVGSQFPNQGSNLCPLPLHRVLTTGSPGMSLYLWLCEYHSIPLHCCIILQCACFLVDGHFYCFSL